MKRLLLICLCLQTLLAGAQDTFKAAQSRFNAERDLKRKEILLDSILRAFPEADADVLYFSIAESSEKARDMKSLLKYLKLIKDPNFRAAATGQLAERVRGYNESQAESLLRTEIGQLYKKGLPSSIDKINQYSYPGSAKGAYIMYMNLYSDILIKAGKYKEALPYAREAYEKNSMRSDNVTTNYALALSKTGAHAEAVDMLEKMIREGKGNAALKSAFKESYTKLHPGTDVNKYITSLEADMLDQLREEVARSMISEPAPSFTLKDVSGKTVSLADFKGKTIVLDFWATWCIPCKKSFPAMQLAVKKYQQDPEVAFLFIHTWEREKDPLADAKGYLADNHFPFDLYMDTKDPATGKSPAAALFEVKGIPAKFVIDGNGKIRFKVTGIKGGDEAMVAELTAMIEAAKKTS